MIPVFAPTMLMSKGAPRAPSVLIDNLSSIIASGVASGTATANAGTGSLIVAAALNVSPSGRTMSTFTDSVGNTYTKAIECVSGDANHFSCSLWYSSNITHAIVSGSTTWTATTSDGTHWLLVVVSVANANNGLDATAAASGTGASGTSESVATGALAQAAEIVFGVWYPSAAAGTFTEGGGFTDLTASDASSSLGNLAYKIVNSTASVTYAPSWTISTFFTGVVASWKN